MGGGTTLTVSKLAVEQWPTAMFEQAPSPPPSGGVVTAATFSHLIAAAGVIAVVTDAWSMPGISRMVDVRL